MVPLSKLLRVKSILLQQASRLNSWSWAMSFYGVDCVAFLNQLLQFLV